MESPFLYPALSQRRCTRVLVLQPAENRDAQVVCSLTEVDLDLPSARRNPYEALSYVWDSPVCNNEITCNGDSLMITESCLTALRYLRMKAHTRTLWIDAICINQKSLAERNKQVALMGDIYKCAQRVLIWLGEASEASEQLLRQLRRVQRLRIAMIFIRDFDLLRKLQRSYFPLTDVECQAFKTLLGNEWWRRTWTLQEFLFAEDSLVMYGSFVFDFETLVSGSDIYTGISRIGSQQTWIDLMQCSRLRAIYRTVCKDRRRQSTTAQIRSAQRKTRRLFAIELFFIAQSRKSSDDKDKIYGLHQILYDCGIILPEPNYALDTAQIYEEATAALLQGSRSLRILELQENAHERHDLPSWVPDFGDVQRFYSERVHACPILDRRHIPVYQHGQLVLQGEIIGNLVKVAGRLQVDAQRSADNYNLSELGGVFYGLLKANHPEDDLTAKCHVNVLQRTFLDTLTNSDRFPKPRISRAAKRNFSELLEILNDTREGKDIKAEAEEKQRKSLEVLNQGKIVVGLFSKRHQSMEYLSLLRQVASENVGRGLFVVSSGDVGLTHADIRIGDLVALFPGASMPYIIRCAGEHHRFIGLARGMYKYRQDPYVGWKGNWGNLASFTLI